MSQNDSDGPTRSEEELLEDKKSLLPGSGLAWHQFTEPDHRILRTFVNLSEIDYNIEITSNEMTALCPLTGFPDFYKLVINYTPGRLCLESKSVKFYLGSFRDAGMFIEALTNRIADDIVKACSPKNLSVCNTMNARGGIPIMVTVERYKERYRDE